MNNLTPYIFFKGNCGEAMNFYKSCFGGTLELMTYGDSPKDACPGDKEIDPNQIMHASLIAGDFKLMASDNPMSVPVVGDNVSIAIHCESVEQTDKLFKALSAGGQVTMPLANMFWGAYYGALQDKYGFHWMLNCEA